LELLNISIPLDAKIGRLGDQGIAFEGKKMAASQSFDAIVSRIFKELSGPSAP
jgi:hypothetical protein